MVVPKMKKAGEASPAVEAHFSTEFPNRLLKKSPAFHSERSEESLFD